jgi:hypothetical protein
MMTRLLILSEDSYGKSFFSDLIKRLKDEGLISNFRLYVDRFYGPCNAKLERQLVTYREFKECDYFLIFQDSDGKPTTPIRERIEFHIDSSFSTSVKIIVLKCEIEDWLCLNEDIPIRNNKPSAILHQKQGYEKYRLKNYVPKLDIEKLRHICDTFAKFISFLENLS